MSTVTFEELESKTYSALASASCLRASMERWSLRIALLGILISTVTRLKLFIKLLKALPEEMVAGVAGNLGELKTSLEKGLQRAEGTGLSSKPVYRYWFAELRDRTEMIGDILESHALSNSREFRDSIERAVSQIKPSGRDWRTSLGEMRD